MSEFLVVGGNWGGYQPEALPTILGFLLAALQSTAYERET